MNRFMQLILFKLNKKYGLVSVITIITVRVVVHTAGAVIDQMGGDDQDNGRQQEPVGEISDELFHHQQAESAEE